MFDGPTASEGVLRGHGDQTALCRVRVADLPQLIGGKISVSVRLSVRKEMSVTGVSLLTLTSTVLGGFAFASRQI